MKNLLLLKIGGGVITDKSTHYGLREDVLERLVGEIATARKELRNADIIIGNGAGSFAHVSAAKYRTAEGFVNDESRIGLGWVRLDAVKLNQIVLEQFLSANVPVFSFSPSSFTVVNNGKTTKLFLQPMIDALEKGLVPIVYGDPIIDEKRGCGIFSTERVFDDLAKAFIKTRMVRVIHISAEDGVYKKGQASVFEKITANNFSEVKRHLGGSKGIDVTGGMLHKVQECLGIAKFGICSEIISGLVPGRVRAAVLGQTVVGTTIC